jgi:hypothetical protein
MARIVVESSQFPLVFVTFPPSISDDELLVYFDDLRALRVEQQDYVLVLDVSSSQALNPTHRKMQAEYIADEAKLPRLYLKAVAFVAPKAIQRGILTAIFWLQKPPMPQQAFSTITEATAWARGHLTKESERLSSMPERQSIRNLKNGRSVRPPKTDVP